jgi:hypothetical protein
VALAVAVAVTAAEAAVVVLLALPFTVPLGLGLAVGLLAAFTTGIVLALRRGQRAPCRCFGASTTRLGPAHVVRTLVLVTVAGTGLLTDLVAVGGAGAPPQLGGVAVALAAAAVGVLIVVRLDDLMALFTTRLPDPVTGRATPPK